MFGSGEYSGAYYLIGYAVECALKACIAKKVKRHDFPDRKTVNDSYTHDLDKLAMLADLRPSLQQRTQVDQQFAANWEVAQLWSEDSRYFRTNRRDSKRLIDAIMDEDHGVMSWVTRHW